MGKSTMGSKHVLSDSTPTLFEQVETAFDMVENGIFGGFKRVIHVT